MEETEEAEEIEEGGGHRRGNTGCFMVSRCFGTLVVGMHNTQSPVVD